MVYIWAHEKKAPGCGWVYVGDEILPTVILYGGLYNKQ